MTEKSQQNGTFQPRPQSLASKTGWSMTAGVCGLFGRLIAQIMIARMLGLEGVGRIAFMVWLVEIVNAFSHLGLPSSLNRYLAELHGQKKTQQAVCFAQWVFVRYLVLALLGSAVVGVLFFYSSQYAGAESMLPVLIVFFLARGLQGINEADLIGRQRFDLLARINVVAMVAMIVGVGVGANFFGVAGALYGYVAGLVFPAMYSFTILRGFSPRQRIDSELRRRVYKYSFFTWLTIITTALVWSRMEIFFLDRYWDVREVAMFTVGLTFAMMIYQVAHLFSSMFVSHFSELSSVGNHELMQRHHEIATRLLTFLVIPLAFGGAAIMPVLLPLLYGTDFAPAVPHAMVVTAGSALAVFLKIGSSLVYAKERPGLLLFAGCVGAILAIAAGFLIISRFGAWGAVWTRLFGQVAVVALVVWFITGRLKVSYPFGALGRNLVSGACCGLVAWSIVRLVPVGGVGLCLAVPVGAAVYIVSARVLHVLGPEERRQLQRVVNRVPLGIRKPCMRILNRFASPGVAS